LGNFDARKGGVQAKNSSNGTVLGYVCIATNDVRVCNYSSPAGERMIAMSVSVSLSVCLSADISQEARVETSPNFRCMLPVVVGRSSADGVAICYL